jgi:hypothetical protein
MRYRLYLIAPDGRFPSAINLECEDDPHAWEMAKDHAVERAAELWQGARFVGIVRPDEAPERRPDAKSSDA